jgi:glycosyltransferase involved in cell wall biosynthesis
VAIEAACSGIPTIAHPSPGMREALGDAATWVRRTAPSQWVDALRRLSERDAWVEASVRALELAAGLNPEPSLNGFAEAITSLVRVPA